MKSLKTRLMSVMLSFVFITVIIMAVVIVNKSSQVSNSVVDEQFRDRLVSAEKMLEVYLNEDFGALSLTAEGQLVDEKGVSIEGRFEYLDVLAESMGVEATIFSKKDSDYVRTLSTITDENNQRIIGTTLDPKGKAFAEINKGKSFMGEVEILENSYYAIYTPVFSSKNDIIGIYFVGVPNQTIKTIVQEGTASTIKYTGLVLLLILALAVFVSHKISEYIAKPIREITEKSAKLLLGETEVNIPEKYVIRNDEIGLLSREFIELADNIKQQALNCEQIAAGNLSIEITPKSEHDILSLSMVSVIETLRNLVLETEKLNLSAIEGRLSNRGEADQFSGVYKQIIIGMNDTLDAIQKPLDVAKNFVIGLAEGTQTEFIPDAGEYKGYYGELIVNINRVLESLLNMLSETTRLTQEAFDGNLSYRADLSKLNGGYAKLVGGVNDTLDALIRPLNMVAGYIEQIGAGVIPTPITEEYNGDYNNIKNSINNCLAGLEGLSEGSAVLEKMSLNDYSAKVEGQYQGIFKKISESINLLNYRMNRVVAILTHVSEGDLSDRVNIIEGGKRSENDTLVPALINMTGNIQAILDEAAYLTQSVIEGRLDAKADIEKYKGAWRELAIGMNNILEEVAKPLKDVTAAMEEISNGNLQASVTGSYKGDFDVLTKTVDTTANRLRAVVGEITHVIDQIAEGNIALEEVRQYRGDFVSISNSLNVIIDSFNSVLGEINMAADQVSVGSKQLSDGSQAFSQGTTEQASVIEELTASVSEVAEKTKENAISAGKANELTLSVKGSAEQGSQHMKHMLEAMAAISDSSKNISRIIKVIDDIAFQTNILALNAAVEAARAGQHGKGFAVVAEEVRTLAERSAEAARDTTDLIQGSIEKVTSGAEIANDTAGALQQIVEGISKTAEIISEIARSSDEQATGISQINTGLSQVSQVVQNNAATAEESAASSEELYGQADMMKEMVGRFILRKQNNVSGSERKLLGEVKRKAEPTATINLIEFDSDKY